MTEKELLDHRKKYRQLRATFMVVCEMENSIGYTPLSFGTESVNCGNVEISQVERLADKLIRAKKRYSDLVSEWEKEQQEIEAILSPFPQEERVVLLAYYSSLSTWEQVAVTLGYSERHIYRLRRQGIARLEKRTE